MDWRARIRDIKKATAPEARRAAIDVRKPGGERVGCLVPVGEWLLDDPQKIALISAWRERAKRMFLTQFDSTPERTHGYVRDALIAREDRLMFLLYDDAERFVGHLGVVNVDGTSGELDNFMRGAEGGDPRLVYLAELALLDWCFSGLGLEHSDVQVLSYNWMVTSLHEEVGFAPVQVQSLRKREEGGVVFHDVVAPAQANVSYRYTRMRLSRAAFYDRFGWLAARHVGAP